MLSFPAGKVYKVVRILLSKRRKDVVLRTAPHLSRCQFSVTRVGKRLLIKDQDKRECHLAVCDARKCWDETTLWEAGKIHGVFCWDFSGWSPYQYFWKKVQVRFLPMVFESSGSHLGSRQYSPEWHFFFCIMILPRDVRLIFFSGSYALPVGLVDLTRRYER